nr:hypothetical protein Iba_chr10cCG2020 [Ipomoea batatas]
MMKDLGVLVWDSHWFPLWLTELSCHKLLSLVMELALMIVVMLVSRMLWLVGFSLLPLCLVCSGGLEVPFRIRMKWGSSVEELKLFLTRGRNIYSDFSKYNKTANSFLHSIRIHYCRSSILKAPL